MTAYIFKISIGTDTQNMGIIKNVTIKRISNKTIIPAFTTSEEQEVLTLGTTKRDFILSGRFIGTESEIDAFIYNLNSAETNPNTINGDNKQCYLFVRNDRTTSGINTSTTASKLIDSNNNFTTAGVVAGMYAINDTDFKVANITAKDNDTTLSLSADIFTDTLKQYTIFENVVPCIVFDFQIIDNGGAPGYIDYDITLKEGEPLNTI